MIQAQPLDKAQSLNSSNSFIDGMAIQDEFENFRNLFDLQLNSVSNNSLELPVSQEAKKYVNKQYLKQNLSKIKYLYLNKLKSTEDIATLFGCNAGTIVSRLRKMGIEVDNHKRLKLLYKQKKIIGWKRKNINEKKIVELYTIEKKTWKQIAKLFKCSDMFIGKILKENNVNTSRKGKKFTENHKLNLSLSHIGSKGYWIGKKRSKEDREKFRLSHLGKKQSEETILKRIKRGEKHYNWKGEITPITRRRTRGTFWKRIANQIRERDNNTCQICEFVDLKNKLPIHHIIPFRLLKSNDSTNLITLCPSCHMKFERLGYKQLQSLLKERYNYQFSEDQKIILDFTREEIK